MTHRTGTRRQFLLATAATVGAIASRSVSAAATQHWDESVDLIVVGSGTGLVGALAAASAGLDVLVLEKDSTVGGTTLVSGGVVWVPNNQVMRREGLTDNADDAAKYLSQLGQGLADEELIKAFVHEGPRMLAFMEASSAIRWRVSRIMGSVNDYHPEWQGARLRGRSVEPDTSVGGLAGGLLIGALLDAAREKGVRLVTNTRVERLVTVKTEQQTAVIGVEAWHGENLVRIQARRGVLIASGGFERNPQMKTQFLRGPSLYTLGAESNTGDGIRMGMEIGADLRNMTEVWPITAYKGDALAQGAVRGGISLFGQIERRYPGMICVNRHGKRFANEAADYGSTWRAYHQWQNWGELGYANIPAFHIFDHSCRETRTIAGYSKEQTLPPWVKTAPTIEALAQALGIDPGNLKQTVERFNHYAAQGIDPDFYRGQSLYDTGGRSDPRTTLKPLIDPPFFGAEVCPADTGTCGGLRIDAKARVIDVRGRIIKGLHASGNTAGVGAPGALYAGGGGTLGPAMTFAYIAGREIAHG